MINKHRKQYAVGERFMARDGAIYYPVECNSNNACWYCAFKHPKDNEQAKMCSMSICEDERRADGLSVIYKKEEVSKINILDCLKVWMFIFLGALIAYFTGGCIFDTLFSSMWFSAQTIIFVFLYCKMFK